jgi:hypothetical protein
MTFCAFLNQQRPYLLFKELHPLITHGVMLFCSQARHKANRDLKGSLR